MVSGHTVLQTPALVFYHAMGIIYFLQIISPANPLSFNYQGFKNGDTYPSDVKLQVDASFVRTDIQITLNTRDQNNNYSVGRVVGSEKMHLWDKSSRKLTDFSTEFSFVIFSENILYGDGLAFFLADPNLPVLKDVQEGGGLGLLDGDQVMNSTKHSFVAVEFDTFHNWWDPQGPHVGMNFNSMMSTIDVAWSADISRRKSYNCSIQYNSSTFNLSVSFTEYGNNDVVGEKYISYKVDLREYLPDWVIFGFSAATGELSEVHILQSWSFNSTLGSDENLTSPIIPVAAPPIQNPNSIKERQRLILVVGLGVGLGLALSFLGLIFNILWKKLIKGKEEKFVFDVNMDDEFQEGTGPKKFCYRQLVTSTNNFSQANKLGQGGFGGVFKGFLKEMNSNVAIKRVSKDSKQGIKEYATEVKIISKLRHRNLVQLIGWCHQRNDLLLVYEFMSNGSLDSHLYHGKSPLPWPVRYNIVLGLASALFYLQEEWEQCVLHRDIKSSNIMLDSNFNPKLGDFGLARLVDHEIGSQTTVVAGTLGYMAPEYFTLGKAKKESDIYSFGVVLLEIASGRKPIEVKEKEGKVSIIEWVWELYRTGKILEASDSKLCGVFDEKQMERLLVVGLWCAHPDYSARPSVRQVIRVLNFEASLPIIPQMTSVPTYLPPTINALLFSFSSFFWATS